MRYLTPLLLLLTLTGCSGSLLQRDPTVYEFYRLDTQKLRMCQGLSGGCLDLSLIAFGGENRPAIERAFNAKIAGPNYPLSLARMLLNPPGGEYQTKVIDENGRYYQLPGNAQTDATWQALQRSFDTLYDTPRD